MLRISLILLVCFSLSGCQALKWAGGLMGGQSGGTQNNITVPIGDNKKKVHGGDEFNIKTLSSLTITKVGDWLKDLQSSVTLILTIIIFCLLFYFMRSPTDKRLMREKEDRQQETIKLLKQLTTKR